MNCQRRALLKGLGAGALATAMLPTTGNSQETSKTPTPTPSGTGGGKMKLSFRPYELKLKHTFTVAGNSRDTTPVVLTEIQYEGLTGYGEA
ncbi:MAG: dipeptide epimerase, partial [Rhodopirellula bahusiensis]